MVGHRDRTLIRGVAWCGDNVNWAWRAKVNARDEVKDHGISPTLDLQIISGFAITH
jgi:hypothetical protein